MIKFALWIITTDADLSARWYRVFSRECFQTLIYASVSEFKPDADTWGLLFVEAGAEGLGSPAELAAFLKGRKHISAIIFCPPAKASNQLISAFLESGADDFILNDLDEKVLISKTRAHIRRLLPSLNVARTQICSLSGDISLDKARRTLKTGIGSKKEKLIETLTPKEFDIFSLLLAHEEEVVSRSYLMEEVWKDKSGKVNTETIDKHVETLRNKLGDYGRRIRTVYGSGYTFKGGER